MTIAELLLPEFDQEMATTRRVLERVPEDKLAWKPHDKSFSMGDLASHIVNMIKWTDVTMNQTEFDLATRAAGGDEPGGEDRARAAGVVRRQRRRRAQGARQERRRLFRAVDAEAGRRRCSSRCRATPACAASA